MMSGQLNERGIGAQGGQFYYTSPSGDSWQIDSAASVAGGAAVATSYVVAGMLIRTANPYGIAAGTAILLVPDVVWFAAGYSLLD
jgi:hypothetical protein